jgi:hypothetical protein
MGDTTTIFIIEVFEFWKQSADPDASLKLVKDLWSPHMQNAVNWTIANAAEGSFGLPQKLTTTYDHFGWEKKHSVVYNAHIYLTALQAAIALADAMGDAATSQAASKALAAGQAAVVDPANFWNETHHFFRATDDKGSNQVVPYV